MARVEAVVICLLVLAMDVAAGVLGVHACDERHRFLHASSTPTRGKEIKGNLALQTNNARFFALLTSDSCRASCVEQDGPRRRARAAGPRHRFLSISGVLCFVHALFCAVYYASASAAAREDRRAAPHV